MEDSMKVQCIKCLDTFSNFTIKQHEKVCNGVKKKKYISNKKRINSNGMIPCEFCDKEFKPLGYSAHVRIVHTKSLFNQESSWNKGLTKETDNRVLNQTITLKKHIQEGSVKFNSGHSKLQVNRKKVSEGMKRAHAEGRAYNIGRQRWKKQPSYPERFFMNVIENEFLNRNYVRELWFHGFVLDFAWVDLKKCIEIDGQQHEREENKKRDIKKDFLLKSLGWEVLRIKWIDMNSKPKEYIKEARNFIELPSSNEDGV